MPVLEIKIDDKDLRRDLKGIRRRLKNPRRGWEAVGKAAVKEVKENFKKGGRPTKWPPRKDNLRHPLLRLTRKLYNSISYRYIKNAVEIGSEVVYAASHNWGYSKRNLPQREFLVFTKVALKEFTKSLTRFFITGKAK